MTDLSGRVADTDPHTERPVDRGRDVLATAAYVRVETASAALAALDGFAIPVVIKADGLAAGKGVHVGTDLAVAQDFARDVLARAHAAPAGSATDDAGMVERLGLVVRTVPGSELAFKVTRPLDLVLAEAVYSATDAPLKALRRAVPPLRLGQVQLDLAFMILFFVTFLLLQLL